MKLRHTIAIPVIIAGVLAILAKAHAQTPAMKRAPAGVTIDGNTSEWGGTLPMYDSATKLSYEVANDDSTLYIVAYTVDRTSKMKIMGAGLTVSINTEGKKKKTYSVTYPLPGSRGGFRRGGDDSGQPTPPPPVNLKISGFKGLPEDITASAANGFKAAAKFDDSRNLGYEIAIPLKLLALKPGADLNINISVNGIDRSDSRPVSSAANSNFGAVSGGRGGGGRGGSGGGGGAGGAGAGSSSSGGGQGGGDDSDMSESQDFWVKLVLAGH